MYIGPRTMWPPLRNGSVFISGQFNKRLKYNEVEHNIVFIELSRYGVFSLGKYLGQDWGRRIFGQSYEECPSGCHR